MKNEKDLLGVGGGAGGGSTGTASILEEFNIDEVVACLHSMERICPSREEYNSLCLLLTVQKLSDHPDFKSWNPSSARLQCFEMVSDFLTYFCLYYSFGCCFDVRLFYKDVINVANFELKILTKLVKYPLNGDYFFSDSSL